MSSRILLLSLARRVSVVAVPVVLVSCGLRLQPMQSTAPRAEIVITEAEIARTDARTAWEAVKRRVPSLTYIENAVGQPTQAWRHGQASLVLDESPLVFVDGVRVSDIRALADIPASEIQVIRVRRGLDSSAEFGTNAASGVILVETHGGR